MMRAATFMQSLAACLVAGSIMFASPSAAQNVAVEGVWQQEKPQTVLLPEGNGEIPFTVKGKSTFDANRSAAEEGDYSFDPTMSSCTSPGQPRLMLTTRPFAIFVRERMITMIYEWNRLFRQVSIGQPFANPALGDGWWEFGTMQGHSVARWDDERLIITSNYFRDETLLDGFLPASDELVLTEELSLVDDDTLQNRITINDPVNYSAPWQALVTYKRQPKTTYPFEEDVCLDRLKAGEPAIER